MEKLPDDLVRNKFLKIRMNKREIARWKDTKERLARRRGRPVTDAELLRQAMDSLRKVSMK